MVLPNTHAQQKYCLENDILIPFYVVNHPGTTFSNIKINQQINQKQIVVDDRKNVETTSYFSVSNIIKGDCLLFNPHEELTLNVKTMEDYSPWHHFLSGTNHLEKLEPKNLIPIVHYKFKNKARAYGYLETKHLSSLLKKEIAEMSTEELLDHPLPKKIVVVYIICDKERLKTCELAIKEGQKWIKKFPQKSKTIPVLARSRRDSEIINKKDKNTSYRISVRGDTPQGIYYLWASMFSENLAFGNITRIDMDATYPPINSFSYEINRFTLEALVPLNALDNYWIQEWPLAFNLGRNTLRLHDNSLSTTASTNFLPINSNDSYQPTDGCINTGRMMKNLLSALVDLKIFKVEELSDVDLSKGLNWKVCPKLGQVFIIIKDTN